MSALNIKLAQHEPIPLDVCLECAKGELVALVGPSGSGKSTILRAIAGIFRSADSLIEVNGVPWSCTRRGIEVPSHKRAVGMVFQNYALFPHMTVKQNILASVQKGSDADKDAHAQSLLEKVNLGGMDTRYPRDLSGGQQQRVAVARALARDPDVLLLDEPFAAVDRLTRRRLYREIIKLRRELQIPVVLVTHDLDEAATLADRMVVLHRGRTLQSGTPTDIMSRPCSTEVARLVDIRNVFSGKIVSDESSPDMISMNWSGMILKVRTKESRPSGEVVNWVIPDGSVLVKRQDRTSSKKRSNTLDCRVLDILITGQSAQLTLKPDLDLTLPLHASLPSRIINLNRIERGSNIKVSLDPDSIHIM